MKKTTYLLRKRVQPDQKYHSNKYMTAFGGIPEACFSLVPGSAAIVTDASAFAKTPCACAEGRSDSTSETTLPSALETPLRVIMVFWLAQDPFHLEEGKYCCYLLL